MQEYDPFGNVRILGYPDNPDDRLFNYLKYKEYRRLKEATGQDFGFEVKKWIPWLQEHEEEYDRGLESVHAREFGSVDILGYHDDVGDTDFNRYKRSVYRHLQEDTGQDFGFDVEKWMEWIADHREEYDRVVREAIKNMRI